ncbi:MAG TPA: metal ABC transporter ATP-binding protein [Candidatus Cloacimonadota bacterium]|nr:metal ABC transporter ATP-binding protein [Candidatus Cloacimonadota bacterium]
MIEIKNLNFQIKSRVILENINISIPKGEFLAIIGPNGAGKSTLLKLMLNLIPLQNGEIMFNQENHADFVKHKQVGYLPQIEHFTPNFPLKVIDLVLMGRMYQKKLFKRFSKQDQTISMNSLSMVNAEHLADKFIANLSGGEFQRVLLARALATESDYIFLDEPEAGIDRVGVTGFYQLLSMLNEKGKTIIAVSHDLDRLSEHCKLVICLNRTMHCHLKPNTLNRKIIHQFMNEGQ